MQLTRVALSNFRNYAELDLEPAPGLNVFIGDNAQGKSNLLEAIAMLGTGKSFRTSRDADLVRDGLELAVVGGDARIRAGVVHLGCTVAKAGNRTRKQYTVNGQGVRYARFLGSIRVVTFVPADLQLVAGPPALRRALVNIALAQEDRQYYHELARYGKALQQKGAMLRGNVAFDEELLAIYDNTLVETGTYLMLARNHFVSELAREAARTHAQWTGGAESLVVRYAPSVPFEAPTAEAVAGAFERRLRELADAERARRATLAGPHRDDLALELDGHSLAAHGSQGQQRTAVLALKVAEFNVMRDRSNEAPLLLLDDVLSELDADRAAAFLAGVGALRQAQDDSSNRDALRQAQDDRVQVFVTATHLPAGLPEAAAVSRIVRASVTPC
jgi:DNA replication and repair protein RecF